MQEKEKLQSSMLKYKSMTLQSFSQSTRLRVRIAGGVCILVALMFLVGWFDTPLSNVISAIINRPIKASWHTYLRYVGCIILFFGIMVLSSEQWIIQISHFVEKLKAQVELVDQKVKKITTGFFINTESKSTYRPLKFNIWDFINILIFIFIAFVYQIAMASNGYPTVILGGDAANLAGFAAARAYPDLFIGDAILGNLDNIALYVTIHVPITIWLEKIVGNFGLAYSLLLFPHVFFQYLSYYLLGRVLFSNRYWSFLFTLLVSTQIIIDGGEVWGVVQDGMPRITFQVIIPFILILWLSAWREKPNHWYWLMIALGLMAFIHPISAPVWGFALWFGSWALMSYKPNWISKILEMIKLGLFLVLGLLPYIFIYLTYHQSGSEKGNYDLIYLVLTKYFPANIMDIPAAVKTLLTVTSQLGLLQFAVIGLVLTFLLFPNERAYLKQLLYWATAIIIISILIPWIETEFERTFRLIPLQTELMRGMRYLILFIFIFGFYPFALLTQKLANLNLKRLIYIIGTVLVYISLSLHPPEPFLNSGMVFDCWKTGQFICPRNTEHAEALTYIRENTPVHSTFAVFLTNRWSGIEVRYLGLRPMVYAYKDKGQLLFTNISAMDQWYGYFKLEDKIFSTWQSPTPEDQLTGIVNFAHHSNADYILTDFSVFPHLLSKLGVKVVFQNAVYSVLEIVDSLK